MDLELSGKIALVAGAGDSIGREIAKVLAAEGVQTVVLAHRGDLLEKLQNEIEKAGGKRPLAIVADLAERSVFKKVRDQVLQEFGHLDIMVNAAGTSLSLPADPDENVQDKAWEHAFALNFTPAHKLANAFFPVMQKRKWGRIIYVTGSLEPQRFTSAHASISSATAFAKGLSIEGGKYGITVNCILPGRIHTEQSSSEFPTAESEANEVAHAGIPLGYFGEPYDIAYMAAFLCSPKARYTNGECIYIDGGLHRAL